MKKILLIGVAVILLCLSSIAGAVDTFWNGTTGDWFSNNWQYTQPVAGDFAYIDNRGTVNITGGTAEAYQIRLEYSTIQHTAGTLSVTTLTSNSSSNYYLSGESVVNSTNFNAGSLYQTGGTINTNSFSTNYQYQLSNGQVNASAYFSLSAGNATQSGGTINATELTLQNAVFNQTGGVNIVTNSTFGVFNYGRYNLSGTAELYTTVNQYLGYSPGVNSQGVMHISGGINSVGNNQYIGYDRYGTLQQTGGENIASGLLSLGRNNGASGTYLMSGGSLSASVMEVGYFGSGNFQIDNAFSDISITNNLFFGVNSNLTAVSGSTINMDGASLDNWNRDPLNLLGLNNLTMITGDIQLVNNRINVGGTEALYVSTLILEAGSTVYLNGMNLYYENLIDNGGQIVQGSGGAGVKTFEVAGQDIGNVGSGYTGNFALDTLQVSGTTVVPEPISSILFLTGGGLLAGRRYFRRKINT